MLHFFCRSSHICGAIRIQIRKCKRTWGDREKNYGGERARNASKQSRRKRLVFSATGGAGPSATVFLKRLGELVSKKKHHMPYSHATGWLRCRLSFALLRSATMCLQFARCARKIGVSMQDEPPAAIPTSRPTVTCVWSIIIDQPQRRHAKHPMVQRIKHLIRLSSSSIRVSWTLLLLL